MSDLQLSLFVIGAVVVGAVFLYNALQERKLRRRLQQAFGGTRDDVLLRAGVESAMVEGRREPQFVPAKSTRGEEVDAEPSRPVAADEGRLVGHGAEISLLDSGSILGGSGTGRHQNPPCDRQQ